MRHLRKLAAFLLLPEKTMSISPELQAKIAALPSEPLKARISDTLNSPGKKLVTNEQIFDSMVSSHIEVKAERALREARLYKWREDEVIAYLEYLKNEARFVYDEYLRQERETQAIDWALSLVMDRFAREWRLELHWDAHDEAPGALAVSGDSYLGLTHEDYRELRVKVRDYAEANLI